MITGESEKTLWFTSDNEQDFLADLEFIEDRNLLVIPNLITNKVIALKIMNQ